MQPSAQSQPMKAQAVNASTPLIVEIGSSLPEGGQPGDEVVRAATPEAIHRSQLHQMHRTYQSRPCLLTHASNPIFMAPSFETFLKTTDPKIDLADRSSEERTEADDLDNAFGQALDLNSANDTDMLNDDADPLNSSASTRHKVLEIKNEEF